MKRLDIMVDLETLGVTANEPLIQLGAIAFDIETGEPVATLVRHIALNEIAPISASTLKWWLDTDKELLTHLLKSGDTSEEDALRRFSRWVGSTAAQFGVDKKQVYLWGNGILFDNYMLREKMKSYGIEYPIYYRNDRDVRTVVDVYEGLTGQSYEKDLKPFFWSGVQAHDALDDCRAQVKMVSACYRSLTVGE